jgi:hypothetical protein
MADEWRARHQARSDVGFEARIDIVTRFCSRERSPRLTQLADYSAYADWDSVNLSVDITGNRP